VYTWSSDDNYSHGFLVPLLSLYFANEATKRGPIGRREGVALGIGLLVFSVVGKLATVVVPVGVVGDLSFLIGLAGLCALLAGVAALKRYWFALAFLVFMVPLPIALYTRIAAPLQLQVSRAASAMLNSFGVPVLCEGNTMTLPGEVRMFVAEACSGMRQLTGFLALTTAVAFLVRRSAWQRLILVASSFPIAMLANVVRVVLTGFIMYRVDPRYASGMFHTLEGLLMMGFGLGLLAAECWCLNLFAPRRQADACALDTPLAGALKPL
jgi:exosortase